MFISYVTQYVGVCVVVQCGCLYDGRLYGLLSKSHILQCFICVVLLCLCLTFDVVLYLGYMFCGCPMRFFLVLCVWLSCCSCNICSYVLVDFV